MEDHPPTTWPPVPFLHLFGGMAAHIVEDDVKLAAGIGAQQLVHKADELPGAVSFLNPWFGAPGVYFQGCVELYRSVPLVVTSTPLDLARPHR